MAARNLGVEPLSDRGAHGKESPRLLGLFAADPRPLGEGHGTDVGLVQRWRGAGSPAGAEADLITLLHGVLGRAAVWRPRHALRGG